MARNSRTVLTFFVAVLLLVVGFLVVLLVMQHVPEWHDVLRDVALAIGPLVIFMLVWEFWLRAARHEEVKDIVATVLRSEFADIQELHRSGLIRIHPSMSNELIRDFIEKAARNLRIFAVFFGETGMATMETLARKASIPDFRMQIIVLKPASQYAMKRGHLLHPDQPNYGQQQAQITLLSLGEALKGSDPSRIQVRVYDSLPSVFVLEADEVALLGFFLNTRITFRNPMLEIQLWEGGKRTILGRMIDEELAKAQTISTAVDLGSMRQEPNGDLLYRTV